MPLPVSYTEATLAEYMAGVAEAVLEDLGKCAADLEFPVRRVLRSYGVATISLATDMTKLESLADYAIWDYIVSQYVTRYAATVDVETIQRQQLYEHAKERLADARSAAGAYGVGGGMVTIHPVARSEDPYAILAATGDEFA